MILIDALFINDGGGKILLDYLVEELEKTDKTIFYLFDERIKNSAPKISSTNRVMFLEGSYLKRKKLYQEYRNKFSTVLCFGNLPPNIKLSATTYTYFHQKLYISVPKNTRFVSRITFWVKTKILYSIKKNSNYWMVQNEAMKTALSQKYHISPSKILVRPFFKPFNFSKEPIKKENTFLYVSNATPHKNHLQLIEQFCVFFDRNKKGELILTVNQDYPEVLQLIKEKTEKKYPITNLGFVNRDVLKEVYEQSEYVIYPSLAESFGLGIVEGIEAGCKIIGADLDYLHQVCIPSLTFNVKEENSIFKSLELASKNTLPKSISKVNNVINQIITELK